MNCVLLGSNSDIAKAIIPMLEGDDYSIFKWSRDVKLRLNGNWDLCIIAIGMVKPVGLWHDLNIEQWKETIYSNLMLPFVLLEDIWLKRSPSATVVWFAGSNPNKIMAGYSSYCASKMSVMKLIEQLDFETPDAKFFALGPGYVDTKIHKPTLESNWPNERIAKGNPTPIEKIYDCLKWCLSQPKEVVGGRNICVSDPYGPELAERLKSNPNLFKLRRIE